MTGSGRCNVGAVVSRTVMLNDCVAVFPLRSVAVHCTAVVPTAKLEPDAGVHATVGDGSVSSVAVAAPYVTGVDGPVASTGTVEGRCRVGGLAPPNMPAASAAAVPPTIGSSILLCR